MQGGFAVWQMGGGCEAYGRNSLDGRYSFLITEREGSFLPEAGDECLVGIYDESEHGQGEGIAYVYVDSLERAVAFVANIERMRVHYSSDGEQAGKMPALELLANFALADGYKPDAVLANGEIANKLVVEGRATGWHDFGQYVAVVL